MALSIAKDLISLSELLTCPHRNVYPEFSGSSLYRCDVWSSGRHRWVDRTTDPQARLAEDRNDHSER